MGPPEIPVRVLLFGLQGDVTVAGQHHKVPRRLLKAARLGLIDLDRR